MEKDKVNIEVVDVQPFENEQWKGIKFIWSGNIGFGEYEIYQNVKNPNGWKAQSECMDTTEDKWFLNKIINNFIEQIEVTE